MAKNKKLLILDCKLEEIKNPYAHTGKDLGYEIEIFNKGVKVLLSHAHEIDIDFLANELTSLLFASHYFKPRKLTDWDKLKYSISQFLESQIKENK
jgi:hypothetical protein